MYNSFEAIADSLIGKGTDPETIYQKLAAWMDGNGVPLTSFKRYCDQPAIVRLFGERGISSTACAKMAVIAPLLRAAYKPGQMPLDGHLPDEKTSDMLADALVRINELTDALTNARYEVAMEIGGRIDQVLRGVLGMPLHRAFEKVSFDLGAVMGEYVKNVPNL